ncbi:MAG: hypothetical protein Q3962_09365 [Corynebacterium sp.]|nr:hypothetical protein [Corynebacterium sp.]
MRSPQFALLGLALTCAVVAQPLTVVSQAQAADTVATSANLAKTTLPSEAEYYGAFLQSLINIVSAKEGTGDSFGDYVATCKIEGCSWTSLDILEAKYSAWQATLATARDAVASGDVDTLKSETRALIYALQSGYRVIAGKSAQVAADATATDARNAARALFKKYSGKGQVIPENAQPPMLTVTDVAGMLDLVDATYAQMSTVQQIYDAAPAAYDAAMNYQTGDYAAARAAGQSSRTTPQYIFASADKKQAFDAALGALTEYSVPVIDQDNTAGVYGFSAFVESVKASYQASVDTLTQAKARVAAYEATAAALDGEQNVVDKLPGSLFYEWLNDSQRSDVDSALAQVKAGAPFSVLWTVLKAADFNSFEYSTSQSLARAVLSGYWSSLQTVGWTGENEYTRNLVAAIANSSLKPAENQKALDAYQKLLAMLHQPPTTVTVTQTPGSDSSTGAATTEPATTEPATGTGKASEATRQTAKSPTDSDETNVAFLEHEYSNTLTGTKQAGTATGSGSSRWGIFAIIMSILALIGGGVYAYQNHMIPGLEPPA